MATGWLPMALQKPKTDSSQHTYRPGAKLAVRNGSAHEVIAIFPLLPCSGVGIGARGQNWALGAKSGPLLCTTTCSRITCSTTILRHVYGNLLNGSASFL